MQSGQLPVDTAVNIGQQTDGVNRDLILPKARPKTSDLEALYVAMNLY